MADVSSNQYPSLERSCSQDASWEKAVLLLDEPPEYGDAANGPTKYIFFLGKGGKDYIIGESSAPS